MKIQVTQDHINTGIPKCPGHCPVSIAIQENIRNKHVRVGYDTVKIENDVFFIHNMPVYCEVAQWINDFDMGLPVEPIEFQIDYPDSAEDGPEVEIINRERQLGLAEINAAIVQDLTNLQNPGVPEGE